MSVNLGAFKPSPNFERDMLNELMRIADRVTSVFRQLKNQALDVPGILKQIPSDPEFQSLVETLAKRFFARCVAKNDDTYKKSFFGRAYKIFKGLSGDEDLTSFVESQVAEKADMFRSIPVELANSLIPHINEWAMEGRSSDGIYTDLQAKLPDLLDFQIRRIARTEISKTLTDITRFKCGKAGVEWYQWRASGGERGDGRTRFSHRNMSGVIVNWGDPPAPEKLFPVRNKDGSLQKSSLGNYHAGCCPNCRCVAMPLVSLSDVEFPARLYSNGKIRNVGKRELTKLLNMESIEESA